MWVWRQTTITACTSNKTVAAQPEVTLWTRGSKLRATGQTPLAKPFHTARGDILSITKKKIFAKHFLIWKNVTYPETITLCKMSGPRTVVMWPSDKEVWRPCSKHSMHGKQVPHTSDKLWNLGRFKNTDELTRCDPRKTAWGREITLTFSFAFYTW